MAKRSIVCVLVLLWLVSTGDLNGQGTAKPQAPRPQPRPSTAKPTAKPTPPAPATTQAKPAPEAPPSDVKIVTTYTQGAQIFQNTTYMKGARQRVEFPGMVSLQQCDLQRTVMLNPAAKRYRVQPYGAPDAAATAPPPAATNMTPQMPGAPGQQPRGGVVTLTTTLTDTLERETRFGMQARRVKTVIVKQTDGTACDKTPMRTEIDAWYVDLKVDAPACAKPGAQAAPTPPPPSANECRDRVETRVVGDVSLGFPIKTVITTVTGETGNQETTTSTTEVTALEITKLDAAMFDIPADYAAASSTMELVPSVAGGASLEEALFGSTADGTSQAAPKRPGAIRIGVLEPSNKSTRTLNTRTLRQDLVSKFSKAPYEALPLSGSSAAAIEADATRLSCDYILLGEIVELKTSKPGRVGGLLKAATGAGGPPKDVHDIKATYRLYAPGATASPRASGEVKASSGSGFTVGSALKMASFAGQMYMGFGMMRMMRGYGGGFGMDPMSMLASSGGFGTTGMNYFDPRAMAMNSAMTSMAMGISGGMGGGMPDDPSDAEVYETVSEALDNIAKAATAKLPAAK